ncbi:MAG: cytochrome c3 family protein [Thermoanaerobaculia bacterium]
MKPRSRLLAAALLAIATVAGAQSITTTKHNLSSSGPGPYRASTETQICVFCHTPHNANTMAPLWNRSDPGGPYSMYWSPTMDAYPSAAAAPQPGGSTKLCLSCHDGTIALGATAASGTIAMAGGGTTLPSSSDAYFGTDLSGHHPVSFRVTDQVITTNNSRGDMPLKSLARMRTNAVAHVDAFDYVQCASCHDAHKNPYGGFLRTASHDAICLACHG